MIRALEQLLDELTVERYGPTGRESKPPSPMPELVDDEVSQARRRRVLLELPADEPAPVAVGEV